MSESNDLQARNWALFCHLAALSIWVGVPFGNILIPLLIWLIKRDEVPLVNQEGKESLNFQISISIYVVAVTVVGIIAFLMNLDEPRFLWLVVLLLVAVGISQIVLVAIAALKVSSGKSYKYPLTIRFIQ